PTERAATKRPMTPREGLRTAVTPVAAWRVATVLRTTSPSKPATHTRSALRVRLIAATAGPIAERALMSMLIGTSRKVPRTSSSIASGSSPASRTAPASWARSSSMRRGSSAMRRRSSSWTASASPSRVARVSVSSMSAPARSASSKARRVFSAPSAASPRWAMRRGLGPGRNREGTARPRSALLLVDEGILFLLVLAPAPAADRAAGAMVWGAARGLRRGGGRRRRRLGRRLVLLRGEVLELPPRAVDQRAREEQREHPPLEGVGQVRAERGVGGGERGGPFGRRLLGDQLAVGAGDEVGILQPHQARGLPAVDRMGLPGRRLPVEHGFGGAQADRDRPVALGHRSGIGRLRVLAAGGDPAAHHQDGGAVLGAEGRQLPEAHPAGELPVAHVEHAVVVGAVAAVQ